MFRSSRALIWIVTFIVAVQADCLSQDLIDVRLRTNDISYPLTLGQMGKLSDGGFLIPASARKVSVDSTVQILIRTDSLFNVVYAKRFKSFKNDVLFSITELSDGNFVVGGVQNRFAISDFGASVKKVDGQGNILWDKVYPFNRKENGIDIYEISDKSLLIFVITSDESFILHTDSLGTIIDQRSYIFGSEDLKAYDIAAYQDSEYFLVGSRQDPVSFLREIHITSIGVNSFHWHKRYRLGRQAYETSITTKSVRGLLASGLIVDSISGDYNSFIMSLDSIGNVMWAHEIVHDSLLELRIQQVREMNDGSIIAVGKLEITPWNTHGLVVKLDRNGNLKWSKERNQLTHQTFIDVLPLGNGRLLFPSYASGGTYFASTDSIGNSACGTKTASISIRNLNILNMYSATPTVISTNFIANTPPTVVLPYVINRSVLCTGTVGIQEESKDDALIIYPNPGVDLISVKTTSHFAGNSTVRIFDINGRLILSSSFNHNEAIDISRLASGFYIVNIENKDKKWRIKLVKK